MVRCRAARAASGGVRVLGGEYGEVQGGEGGVIGGVGVMGCECGEVQGGEGGVIDSVGVAEDYPDGPFLYLFKATELGDKFCLVCSLLLLLFLFLHPVCW